MAYFFYYNIIAKNGVVKLKENEKGLAEPNYIASLEDIRAIAQGENDQHRTMTWREAVEIWEQAQDASDERARAAFFVHIGIATTGECLLLDGTEDDA